jgi:hypothetical protein
MEYYVTIDTAEEDGSEWNHLLKMVVRGKEYLISATAPTQLGHAGDRIWVTWSRLECDNVTTIEQVGDRFVSGKVNLCTATNVRDNS